MPITLNFNNRVQDSVQVGDTAYFTPTSSSGVPTPHFSYDDIVEIGAIETVNPTSIVVDIAASTDRPDNGDFILFSKDNVANMSSLAGYYAEVKMENHSNEPIELYAISSEIVESSK